MGETLTLNMVEQRDIHMKRKFIIIYFLINLAVLTGCNKTTLEKVQNGVLDTDKTLTIGSAFNNYKFFKDKSWKEEKDGQGRSIVIFEGTLNTDTNAPINEALYISKHIRMEDYIAYVDIVTYYRDFPLSITKQLDDNKKEADLIAKEIEGRRDLIAKVSITFAKSLKDDDVIVLNKKVLITDVNGNEVSAMCDQQQVSSKLLSDIYKNLNPDGDIAECIFKTKIVPINTLKEYPKDIEYLKSIKSSGK